MELEVYISKMRELANIAVERVVVPAANEMLAKVKNRIALDGKNTQGAQIGQYSTRSAYFGIEQFDKKSSFKPQGKGGKNKQAKTMYLGGGYSELRQIQGKPVDKMNMNYTGSTLAHYQQTSDERQVLQGFTTEKSALIRQGQEKKRGNIFAPTKEEIAAFNVNVRNEVENLQTKILTSV